MTTPATTTEPLTPGSSDTPPTARATQSPQTAHPGHTQDRVPNTPPEAEFGLTREQYLLPADTEVRLIEPDGTLSLTASGTPGHAYPMPEPERLREAYRRMAIGRKFNEENSALVRQGKMAVYPSSLGQEACQVAAALALGEPGDPADPTAGTTGSAATNTDGGPQGWLFPTYRDSLAALTRGIPAGEVMTLFRGDWHGGYNPHERRVSILCTPLTTQLLHAVGLAHAAKLRGEDTVVVAMCGDGATSEGDFHEALNFAAVFHVPVVFLVQNNGYAISVPLERQSAAPTLAHKGVGYGIPGEHVDGNCAAAMLSVMDRAVALARSGAGPFLVEAHTYRMDAHTNADDATRYRDSAEVEQWRSRDPLLRLRTYLQEQGLWDAEFERSVEQDTQRMLAELRGAFAQAPDTDPRELFAHVYAQPTPQLAEQEAQLCEEYGLTPRPAAHASHGEGDDTVGTDGARGAMSPASDAEPDTTLTLAGALNLALADAMAEDPTVLVFGEDVGTLGGVFRVSDGLASRFGDKRCFDTPLAESGIVGVAVGMAMKGLRPVVEMQFDAYAYPALEQIFSHVAKMRNRTRGAVPMPIVIRVPYGGGIGGVEHHSDSSESYYAHTPGLIVAAPATATDAYTMLRAAIASEDPVIFLEPKNQYFGKEPVNLAALRNLWASRARGARVAREGTDATLVAYGPSVATALAAADAAAQEGRSLEVIDLRWLTPYDDAAVERSVTKTGNAIVVSQSAGFASVASEMVARIQERCFYSLNSPVQRVSGFDIPYPAPLLEKYYLPDVDRVLDAVDRLARA